jgi:hypothetical protein
MNPQLNAQLAHLRTRELAGLAHPAPRTRSARRTWFSWR